MAYATQLSSMPDHQGARYTEVLSSLHRALKPSLYLEIGTNRGRTLALAAGDVIAVDPKFLIDSAEVFANKTRCQMFQMTSDDFFAQKEIEVFAGRRVDFAFLDGMHLCEFLLRDFYNTEECCRPDSVIALHDCAPVESGIAQRENLRQVIEPHRRDWWAGDVWRTVLALKRFRPDLNITVFDAPPTGLVLVSRLNPFSTTLRKQLPFIVDWMMSQDLQQIGMQKFFDMLGVQSTTSLDAWIKVHHANKP